MATYDWKSGLANAFGLGSGGYTLSNPELSGLSTSYSNLGGAEGTGMDYNAWLDSQGINAQGGFNNSPAGGATNGLSTAMGIGDLAMKGLGAWTAMEQLGLAKDAFNYNKMDRDRSYAMAKDAYDRQVKRADSVGSQMQAGKVG